MVKPMLLTKQGKPMREHGVTPLFILMMCTATSKQKKQIRSNKAIGVGTSTPSASLAYDQSGYVIKKTTPAFVKAHQLLNENIDLCISQCRSYKDAWYPRGEVANPVNLKFELSQSMSTNLVVIKKNHNLLKSDELRFVFMSGGRESKCEHFIKRLAGLHETMFSKAISYHSMYNDLDTIVTEAENEKNDLNNQMAGCKQ